MSLSPYTRRLIWTTALASFLIGLALSTSILVVTMRGAEAHYQREIRALEDANLSAWAQIYTLEDDKRELSSLISDMVARESLIGTFLDAGFSATTPAEIRALLEEADKLPFGSPFHGGHRVTSQYGVYSIPEYGWSGVDHPGLDVVSLNGDRTLYSTVDGVITDYGVSNLWGKWMTIETSAGYQLFFAHLDLIYFQVVDSHGNWSLPKGTAITKGQRIAEMGSTGAYATGVHLHFELRIRNDDGDWVTLDPEAILGYVGNE